MASAAVLDLSVDARAGAGTGFGSILDQHILTQPVLVAAAAATATSVAALAGLSSHRVFASPIQPRSYTILKEVGDGSFGTVSLADWHSPLELPKGTLPPGPSSRAEYKGKKLVAIKRMKKAFEGGWDECIKLKELKSLQQLPMHANIIPLYDAFLSPTTKELYFVFECMEGNLYQLTKSRKGRRLASGLIASLFYQILSGLHHIHSNGYFHRDMKPENLLITTTGLADYPPSALYAQPGTSAEKDVVVIVKIADFGLARETGSAGPYTEYVSTRWYRSPEILLRSRHYSTPVDLWALGTIMVEVVTLKPIFPGETEVDQVYRICEVLGDPSPEYGVDDVGNVVGGGAWEKGVQMAKEVGFAFPKIKPKPLSSLFDSTTVPSQLVECIADLLRYEPNSRLTTRQCLDHDYFRVAARFAPYHSLESLSLNPSTPTMRYTSNLSQSALSLHDGGSQYSSTTDTTSLHAYVTSPPSVTYTLPDPSLRSMDHHQSVPSSAWSSSRPDNSWGQLPIEYRGGGPPSLGYRSVPAFGTHVRRTSFSESIAASTFYDGSIFEGIAPSRASSIMSFPVGYSTNPSVAESSSIRYGGYPSSSRIDNDSASLRLQQQQQQQQPQHHRQDQQQQQQPPLVPIKSKGWSLGSVFSSTAAPSTPSIYAASNLGNNSARPPSTVRAMIDIPRDSPLDSKKAKKEAEKQAKESEKARREAQTILARERARAVMRKNVQLDKAADPLHSIGSNQTGEVISTYKGGKARSMMNAGASGSTGPTSVGSSSSGKLAQIIESGQRLSVGDNRYKARRRDVDNDVHSIGSSGTEPSYHRGRPYSVSSQATSSSEPDMRLTNRLVSPHRHANRAPNTGHSLDQQFINEMRGLATGSPSWNQAMENRGMRSPTARTFRSEEQQSFRSTSPRESRAEDRESGVDPRYNPYRSPSATYTPPPIRPHTNSSAAGVNTAPLPPMETDPPDQSSYQR